jgi:cell division protein ZapA
MAEVVTITINGRTFRMGCDDGQEEHLLGLAKIVDEKINLFKGSYGEIGETRLTVMAAIMLADELNEATRQNKSKEREMAALKETIRALNERLDQQDSNHMTTLKATAEEIIRLAEKIKQGGE